MTKTEDIKNDPDFRFDPSKADDYVSLGNNEWAEIDIDHGGWLWFTQAHQDKFECGEDEIDWEEYKDENGEIEESHRKEFDEGYKWWAYLSLIAGQIVNDKGEPVREADHKNDWMLAHELPPEALDAEGCVVVY